MPDKTEVQTPRVIVEMLSASTEAYDRGEKLGYYRSCPHVQEYVLIATKYQTIEVYRRTSPRWTYDAYGPGNKIELASLDIRLPLATLYRRVLSEAQRRVEEYAFLWRRAADKWCLQDNQNIPPQNLWACPTSQTR
jgi:hypothetical protein